MAFSVEPISISSWTEFVRFVTGEFDNRWQFRGSLSHHRLESALERAALHWGFPLSELPEVERRLLRDFKRAFPPRAEIDLPPRDADLDWLALMQHHGAPTRLLDCTYSPFVAAFFALEMLLKSPPDPERSATVWAFSGDPTSNDAVAELIPQGRLREQFAKLSAERAGPAFRAVFLEADPPLRFATPVNPYQLHERLITQQGVFMCPGDISQPFEANLEAVPGATAANSLKKLLLARSMLAEGFAGLRSMNITAASLFPGIDGYARSQFHSLEFLRSVPLFEGSMY
ncbi:MAG TPA: FRG domain-containing protein [Gemmatimonadales bacterium]|nr:FRG domain-containing protein [Gemmatimonadales bacterium]